MFRTVLALASLLLIPQCAIAQSYLVPDATIDGGPSRTLDLAGIGADCGNLSVDLSAKTMRCDGNTSINRLTNVDNVNGPTDKVPFQAFGNAGANVLVDRNGMSVLVGNEGDDTLVAKSASVTLYGGPGVDRFYSPTRTTKVASYWPIVPGSNPLRRYTSKTAKAAGVSKVAGRTVVSSAAVDVDTTNADVSKRETVRNPNEFMSSPL